jgi:hypothetical protein
MSGVGTSRATYTLGWRAVACGHIWTSDIRRILYSSAQVATWESDCSNYNRTEDAWKTMQQKIADFNAVLAKNHLQKLNIAPTKLTDSSCSFKAGSN